MNFNQPQSVHSKEFVRECVATYLLAFIIVCILLSLTMISGCSIAVASCPYQVKNIMNMEKNRLASHHASLLLNNCTVRICQEMLIGVSIHLLSSW